MNILSHMSAMAAESLTTEELIEHLEISISRYRANPDEAHKFRLMTDCSILMTKFIISEMGGIQAYLKKMEGLNKISNAFSHTEKTN